MNTLKPSPKHSETSRSDALHYETLRLRKQTQVELAGGEVLWQLHVRSKRRKAKDASEDVQRTVRTSMHEHISGIYRNY